MTALRDIVAQPGETHIIYGTTRAGKSVHDDLEMREIQDSRPDCMQLLVDTKPRFRAETERMPYRAKGRVSASWRYKHWRKGPVLPGSVLVPIWDDHPFRGLWSRPGEIAVMQSGDALEWRRMLVLLMHFARAQIGDRERHVTADEVLDFYGRTTHSINNQNDVFYLVARSGGERLIGQTLGSQRVHGLPILIRNMARRVTLYQLSEEKDIGYLAANGIRDAEAPPGNFQFRHWVKEPGGRWGEPLNGKLAVPQDYLEQLSAA